MLKVKIFFEDKATGSELGFTVVKVTRSPDGE
jgi:hypothetical protein